MNRFLVPARPVGREMFAAFAEARGFDQWYRPPPTGGFHQVVAGDGEGFVRWMSFTAEGGELLVCEAPLAEAVAAAFDAIDVEEALRSDDPVGVVGLAASAVRVGGPPVAREALLAHLDYADPIVRRLAGRFVWMLGADALPSVRAAAERHPDLGFALGMLEQHSFEAAAGTLDDLPTTDTFVLAERALEAALAGQLERARRAAEPLLEDQPYNHQGIYALGVASVDDNPLVAAFLLGAVAEVRRYDDEALEFPDVAERLAAVRDRPVTDAHRAAGVDVVLRFVGAWVSSSSLELSRGGALAIRGHLPELEALSTFLVARWTNEPTGLAAAAALAPGVPWFRSQLLQVLDELDPERADRERAVLIADLREGIRQSPLDERIDLAVRGFRDPVTASSELGRRASAAYARKDHDRAVAFADEALVLDPHDVAANQVRALAFTFSDRFLAAIGAYADTIAAMNRSYADPDTVLFDDPRPGMWFNRACCEARLGAREDALESLRHAVGGDEEQAAKAEADDWLAPLWDDPEFRAIVACDPEALVLAEHRTAAFAVGLLAQAIDAENRGAFAEAAELAEQAATVAARAGAVAVRAEALARRARSLAFSGHVDPALSEAELAARLAEDPAVPPQVRGDVFAQLGVVRQTREELDLARYAYLRSLEARATAGDPLLVARSELTLSALELALGDTAGPRARIERALPLLRAAVDAGAPAAVHDDLATAWVRLAMVEQAEGSFAAAVEALRRAVEGLSWMVAAGTPPLAGVVGSVVEVARQLGGVEGAHEVGVAATLLSSSGSAAEDRVRALFRELGLAVAVWRRSRNDDPTIARWFADALAGRPVPPEIEPVVRPFRTLLVELAARESTLLVTSAMAVELAATALDRTLGELGDLWAAAARASDDG